jgi:hypothetical protein
MMIPAILPVGKVNRSKELKDDHDGGFIPSMVVSGKRKEQ